MVCGDKANILRTRELHQPLDIKLFGKFALYRLPFFFLTYVCLTDNEWSNRKMALKWENHLINFQTSDDLLLYFSQTWIEG